MIKRPAYFDANNKVELLKKSFGLKTVIGIYIGRIFFQEIPI